MKTIRKIIIFLGVACLLTVFAGQLAKVWTKKETFPEKNLTIQKTYRGDQCILVEINDGNKKSRCFMINGKNVAVEADEDGDGFFESFGIFDPNTDEFELFTRTTNGLVFPVDSAKLQDLRLKKEKADKTISELLQTNMNVPRSKP